MAAVGVTAAFNSTECDLLERALDAAWQIFLRSRKLDVQNFDIAKAALTHALLQQYESGEHNVRRMAIAAVASVELFQAQPSHKTEGDAGDRCDGKL